MRILNLTNFYPPCDFGGYEQWCEEVSEGLRARGHETFVLTSRWNGSRGQAACLSPWVFRDLHLEMQLAPLINGVRFFVNRRGREARNVARLRSLISELQPDCVLIWGMWNIPASVAAAAEHLLPGRVAYYLGDYWPTLPGQWTLYWDSPGRTALAAMVRRPLRSVAKRMIARDARPELALRHVMFPTAFMRDELARRGVRAETSEVVYGAIDTRLYDGATARRTPGNGGLRLLCASRLTPEKGVHTAIDALGHLARDDRATDVRLTIAGSGDASYEDDLRNLARDRGVSHLVTFLGAQPKEAMPAVYRSADVFLFTSIWPEPFGRAVVEAMASGLPVIGAATGGAAEILVDGENALLFRPGDHAGLAAQVLRLVESPAQRRMLCENARQVACERYDIGRMTVEIEQFLAETIGEKPRNNRGFGSWS